MRWTKVHFGNFCPFGQRDLAAKSTLLRRGVGVILSFRQKLFSSVFIDWKKKKKSLIHLFLSSHSESLEVSLVLWQERKGFRHVLRSGIAETLTEKVFHLKARPVCSSLCWRFYPCISEFSILMIKLKLTDWIRFGNWKLLFFPPRSTCVCIFVMSCYIQLKLIMM